MTAKNQINCSNCGVLIEIDDKFCFSCGFNQVKLPLETHKDENLSITKKVLVENNRELSNNYDNVINPSDKNSKNIAIPIIVFVALIFIALFILPKSQNGLYHDSFNNSLELQTNGIVIYNQLNNAGTLSCQTSGTWQKINENQLTIRMEYNYNCSFVSRYSGDWEIQDCFKSGHKVNGCLVKENYYFFRE